MDGKVRVLILLSAALHFAAAHDNDLRNIFIKYEKQLPKTGMYVLVRTDEIKISVLNLTFFSRALKSVEYQPVNENGLFQANIRSRSLDDRIEKYNFWNGSRQLLNRSVIPDTITDFRGRTLRATTFEVLPTSYMENGKWTGYENRIMNAIADSTGIILDIHVPPNGETWGTNTNGSFSGLVGELQYERADIGWANLYIKTDRKEIMDFTEPYRTDPVCFMYKKPPPAPQWMAIMSPLDVPTWIGTFGAILLVSVVLTFITNLNIKEKYVNIYESSTIVFGSIIERSFLRMIRFRSSSSRIFVCLWLLVAIVICTGYKGMLVSVLTVPGKPTLINSLKSNEIMFRELADHTLPVTSNGDVFLKLFKEIPDPSIQKIAARYEVHNNFSEAFRNLNESTVILGESQVLLKYVDRSLFTDEYGESVNHILPQCAYSFNVGIGLPLYSPYHNMISRKLIQLKESGLTFKYIDIDFDKFGKAAKKSNNANRLINFTSLGLYNLQVGFYLFGFGLLLSVAILFVEIAYKNIHKSNSRKIHL